MTILGHVQRGGTPTAYDRVLATRFGVGRHRRRARRRLRQDGRPPGRATIVRVPLGEAVGELKTVDPGSTTTRRGLLR